MTHFLLLILEFYMYLYMYMQQISRQISLVKICMFHTKSRQYSTLEKREEKNGDMYLQVQAAKPHC